ncbi:unnamed protein product [Mycena citricolor]|uniref:Fungal-type protein kinase domain-containing protein n=1 Tax=Mycena citricolor TaxID=2018698 RepID=A0AAD2H937_9AGAR|nr:unnamed protein product [Mycena citricolor]
MKKQNAALPMSYWKTLVHDHFHHSLPPEDFLNRFVGYTKAREKSVREMLAHSETALEEVKSKIQSTTTENNMVKPVCQYLNKLVGTIPRSNRPKASDCHSTMFVSPDVDHHGTCPDVALSLPGLTKAGDWATTGVTIQLKTSIDGIDKQNKPSKANEPEKALVQLAKDARHIMMTTNKLFVFVIALMKTNARIYRFDVEGWHVTHPFNWQEQPQYLATFLQCVYDTGRIGRMLGDDETITAAPSDAKQLLTKVLNDRQDDPYIASLGPVSRLVSSSEAIDVAVFDDINELNPKAKPHRRLVPTKAYTIGETLWHSHSLFGRATKVRRVILHDDLVRAAQDSNILVKFYALKDSWRQRCRRPELDYYDSIWYFATSDEGKAFSKQAGIDIEHLARCTGSIDMSLETVPDELKPDEDVPWRAYGHQTNSSTTAAHHRFHTRTLITPIGTPLEEFKCTMDLANAAYDGTQHLCFAHQAGVSHRDVSDGNVMFVEQRDCKAKARAFLLDWDYAEFTEAGAERFKALWPERYHVKDLIDVSKSLKDLTGTWPFMALDILDYNGKLNLVVAGVRPADVAAFRHALHHDLESFFWLLVWMVFRHTEHHTPSAVQDIFGDRKTGSGKSGYLRNPVTPGPKYDTDSDGLFRILDTFHGKVVAQNPIKISERRKRLGEIQAESVLMDSNTILRMFSDIFADQTLVWHTTDKAKRYIAPPPPNADEFRSSARQSDMQQQQQRQQSGQMQSPDGVEARESAVRHGGADLNASRADSSHKRKRREEEVQVTDGPEDDPSRAKKARARAVPEPTDRKTRSYGRK